LSDLVPRKRQATWRQHDEIRRSTCGNCPTGCGVKGFLHEAKLVDLFGDEDHPTNKGSFCPKGLLSWVLQGHPDRITTPRIRDRLDESFRECSWNDALGRIADHLATDPDGLVVAHSDEGATFGYQVGASQFAGRFKNHIGPESFQTTALSPDGRLSSMFGLAGRKLLMNSQRDWAFSRAILVVGSDLGTTDPVTLGPLVDVRDRGGSLIVVDSKTTITAVKASYHVRVNPGTESVFLAAIANYLLISGKVDKAFLAETVSELDEFQKSVSDFSPDRASSICGIPAEEVARVGDVIGNAHPFQVMCGEWLSRSKLDDDFLGLCATLVLLRGSVGIPGGGLNILDASPFEFETGGRHHLENLVLDGNISTLMLHGNPLAQMGGGNPVRDRLGRVPLVVQMGGFYDETARHAHILLPLTTWVEEDGLNLRNNGRAVQWREALIAPRGSCRPALDVWHDLATSCGFKLTEFDGLRSQDLARAVADNVLGSDRLTQAIRTSDLTPTGNSPGGILWPSVDRAQNIFEDDRFGRGDVRGKNILFRRHHCFADFATRFPNGAEKINLSSAFIGKIEEFERQSLPVRGSLKMIVTVGVDFIPGWSGAKPTPNRSATQPIVRVHPETGLHLGIITGSLVTLSNELGSVVGRAELSMTVAPGVIWCIETPGHGVREMTAFGLLDVPADGLNRPAFALVDIKANNAAPDDTFALMLGR